ncbi:MAG: GNAT family N-acetyltransferase [Faecousia sp.]
MLFPEKEIHLKDGRAAVLRSPTREDAPALVDYMVQTAGETDFLLRTPEECTMTVEAEAAFLQNICDSPASVMILCMVDGKLAGNCQITRMNRLKTRHRGTVAIALLKEYWSLGIGAAMFAEMIAIAEKWGLKQLELEYIEGNDRARRLYEKMGFRTTGALPNAIQLADGTMLKDYQMVRNME